MLKLKIKPVLACLSMLGLPLLSSTTLAASATERWSLTCSTGNFQGEATGYALYMGNNAKIVLDSYRITKSNDQQGGNKANVNLEVIGYGDSTGKHKSKDAMKQDGQWHALNLDRYAKHHMNQVQVEFIFDKSGADPRCTARYNLKNPGRESTGTLPPSGTPNPNSPVGVPVGSLILPPQ